MYVGCVAYFISRFGIIGVNITILFCAIVQVFILFMLAKKYLKFEQIFMPEIRDVIYLFAPLLFFWDFK
jgi:hypothetical protein